MVDTEDVRIEDEAAPAAATESVGRPVDVIEGATDDRLPVDDINAA